MNGNGKLTIKEASSLTNKCDMTIRRMVKQLYKQDKSLYKQVIDKGKYNKILIDKEFLLEKFESEEKNVYSMNDQCLTDVITLLKQQLQEKDKQIEALIERNRETNIIINNLQNKLLMLEAPKREEQEKKIPAERKKGILKSVLTKLRLIKHSEPNLL
jgi:plasmid maintenance system killer protein